jgi:hypothetical protein
MDKLEYEFPVKDGNYLVDYILLNRGTAQVAEWIVRDGGYLMLL